jgi:hypothetical protein
MIASRKPDIDASNVAMSVLRLPVVTIVCIAPAAILPVGGVAIGNSLSRTSNAGVPVIFGGAISSASLTVRDGGISFGTASCLRRLSRLSCERDDIGGCTGASGRGGMFVLGATGGGGLEVGGCPSASNNLRI